MLRSDLKRMMTRGRYGKSYKEIRLTVTEDLLRFGNNSGSSCSKLMMSLVNDSLKFTSSDTQIC